MATETKKQPANTATAPATGTRPGNTDSGEGTFTVDMTLEKTTKNALRYNEDEVKGVAPRIGQLYVQKHALPGAPEHISVTVDW